MNRGDGGPATGVQLGFPNAVAVDRQGNLYISDEEDDSVRKITLDGIITTFAGPGSGRPFFRIGDLAVDAAGNLYVADYRGVWKVASNGNIASVDGSQTRLAVDSGGNLYLSGCTVRKISTAGVNAVIAGNGTCGYSGDGGPALAAQLYGGAIAVDAAGNLYIALAGDGAVRRIQPGGQIPSSPTTAVTRP